MEIKRNSFEWLGVFAIFAVFFVPAEGIRCYQCISTNNSHPFQCNEFLSSDIDMEPTSCDDVFGAQYCVKHVGRFEGTTGGRNYCIWDHLNICLTLHRMLLLTILCRAAVVVVLALDCYQCTTADDWKCMDSELVLTALEPKSCDHVFEAQYCVKTIGKYGDGIGTKRFCSSVHLGNYCDYVKHSGDQLEYRTCLYTCTGDGCNPASALKPNSIIFVLSSLISLCLFTLRR